MPFSGGNLGALGSGIAQGYDPAYDNAVKQAGQIALGKTLQMLGGGNQQGPMGQPGQPPMGGPPPPQQPPMAGGPPQGPPPQMAGPPPMPQGPPPVGGPQQASMPPPPMQRPMGGPPIGPPGGQPMPPQQGMQPGGPPQPQGFGPQGQQQGGGPLDWRQIFQMVMKANPGAPPQVIAAAVNGALPLMNSQAQIEWKNYIAPQLAQQRMAVQQRGQDISADVRERGQDVTARGQDIRATTAEGAQATAQRGQDIRADTAAGVQATTQRGQDIRAQTATDNRISRETIAAAGREGRQAMFEAGLISKEAMDAANREERGRESDQRVGATVRGQDVRAGTAAAAEEGRMKRAELSNATKQELGKLSIETRREIAAASEAGKDYRTSYQEGARTQRTQLSNEARKEIAGMSEQARKELTEYVEGGRMERSEQARTSREDIAAQGRTSREGIASAGREERGKEAGARLDVQKSALQTRTEAINTQRQIYGLPPVGTEQAQQIASHSPAVTGADRIADQIVAGKKPPNTQGLGMHGGFQVQQSLATRYPEFDQTQATLEYEAAKRTVSGMTSPQQVRFQQLGKAVVNTFDKVVEDARKMKLSGITPLNKADIDYLVHTRGNTPAGKLAATYLQDVAFLKGEVANLENGGYAPTESSWEQAKQVINENYGVDEMIATAHNAQRLINFRLHALTEMPGGQLGVGSGAQNRYLQPGAPSPRDQRGGKQDLGGGWSVQEH